MKELNRTYRNKDALTDVLSFECDEAFTHSILGSVVVCMSVAKKQAKQHKISLDDELRILFLHGLLHLLGFDHENDDGQMAKQEEKMRKKFDLPLSLIEQNKE